MDSSSGLPRWLAHPLLITNNVTEIEPVSSTDSALFDALGIDGLFSFQRVVRERLLDRHPEGWRDMCVSAPTGSGKTLAYVLPIVEGLKGRIIGRLGALVVVPTRDLIGQVEDTFRAVIEAHSCDLKIGIDFLVLTPGRLITLLPDLQLESLKYLVVDEADRLLDQSFQEWLPQLLLRLERGDPETAEIFDSEAWQGETSVVKKLLFSATLTTNPAKIAPLHLHRPLYLSVRPVDFPLTASSNNSADVLVTPETLEERVAVFGGAEELKPAVLAEILIKVIPELIGGDVEGILCFTKSVSSAQRLSRLLSQMCPSLRCASFHGNLTDTTRSQILSSFENGEIGVLVGSDAMARGLDLKSVRCVVNYDAPGFAATYVHRVGRTARAGNRGLALTLLPAAQMRHFKLILRGTLNKTIVDVTTEAALEYNEVGKMEIDTSQVEEKWKNKLIEALKHK